MTISSEEAAEIAKRNGLSLTDAAALQRLATTVEEASDIAAVFNPAPPDITAAIRGKIREAADRRTKAARTHDR